MCKIEKLRDRLNKLIEKDSNVNEIIDTSRELDIEIVKYIKNQKEINENITKSEEN